MLLHHQHHSLVSLVNLKNNLKKRLFFLNHRNAGDQKMFLKSSTVVCKENMRHGVKLCGKQAPGLGRFMGPRQNMMGLRGQDRTEGED